MKIFHSLEKIVESRFVGEAKPNECERKTIAEFEKKRKYEKLEFTPFSFDIQNIPRKNGKKRYMKSALFFLTSSFIF